MTTFSWKEKLHSQNTSMTSSMPWERDKEENLHKDQTVCMNGEDFDALHWLSQLIGVVLILEAHTI